MRKIKSLEDFTKPGWTVTPKRCQPLDMMHEVYMAQGRMPISIAVELMWIAACGNNEDSDTVEIPLGWWKTNQGGADYDLLTDVLHYGVETGWLIPLEVRYGDRQYVVTVACAIPVIDMGAIR